MKAHIRNTSLAMATTLLVLTASSTDAAVISDDFSLLNPPSAGQSLIGTNTPVGGVAWQELWPAVSFAGTSNGYITNGFAEGGGAFVSLASITSGNTQFTLSGSINPEGMGTGFVSLGFSSSVSSQTNTGEIWSLLTPTGIYSVYLNGTTTLVATGTAPGFVSNGFNEVSMTLDSTTGLLNVSINNTAIVTNYNIGFTPTLTLAGFTYIPGTGATTQTAQFDNFVVSSAVPEPSSVALVGLSLASGLYLRRRTIKRC
jgi:hypothetical protein